MTYEVIIVGGGIAGLTASAFLSKEGYKTLICEKEKSAGGLIGSFCHGEFIFDKGIRATENSGILFPMLNQLGIEIEFLINTVSLGIEDEIIDIESRDSLNDYSKMLINKFPESKEDITQLIQVFLKIMNYMDILYGIDNPLFMNLKEDREFIFKTLIPWIFKYAITVGKIKNFRKSAEEFVAEITDNTALNDIITQHFFKKTPAFFALSYFRLYLDYKYPKGGTGKLVTELLKSIEAAGGEIGYESEISCVNPDEKTIEDTHGNKYKYRHLIWASDLKSFYNAVSSENINSSSLKKQVIDMKKFLSDKSGGDSVFTLYLTTDIDKKYFEKKHGAHFFYTPSKDGISKLNNDVIKTNDNEYIRDKSTIKKWLKDFYRLNTFEISIPVMRDPDMAPEGKTGLIISLLMDFSLVDHINKMGWYDEFKLFSTECMVSVLESSVYSGLTEKIIDSFTSSPLTIQRFSGNNNGAITGWAFTNNEMPAVNSMPKIAKSVETPFKDISQAGQWTYSPSGLPISILTGKLAANRAKKNLK